jgi:hypothetical protein
MLLRAVVRPGRPSFAPFPRIRDGGKAGGGRDGRTAKRPDGPARASSSPRPVIRGETFESLVLSTTCVFGAFGLTGDRASSTICREGGPERRLYGP